MNKLVESEAFIDSIRFKGTKVKINACSRFLQLFYSLFFKGYRFKNTIVDEYSKVAPRIQFFCNRQIDIMNIILAFHLCVYFMGAEYGSGLFERYLYLHLNSAHLCPASKYSNLIFLSDLH